LFYCNTFEPQFCGAETPYFVIVLQVNFKGEKLLIILVLTEQFPINDEE
jgi:hypothetical protein